MHSEGHTVDRGQKHAGSHAEAATLGCLRGWDASAICPNHRRGRCGFSAGKTPCGTFAFGTPVITLSGTQNSTQKIINRLNFVVKTEDNKVYQHGLFSVILDHVLLKGLM